MRFAILAIITLSACTSLVPSTVMRLNGLSPITADPAGFAVNLTLPDGIDVTPGTARLMFAVTRSDTGAAQSGDFVLAREGTVFRIAQSDHDALRALQATAADWNGQNDTATNGSLSITLTPCLIGAGPAADARVSVGLRLEEGGDFLPLVRGGQLSAVASADELRDRALCP